MLFDGKKIRGAEPWNGAEDAALRTAIQQAQQMPHALPGKVGLVGFSLGGGQVLFYGSQMSDLVAVVQAGLAHVLITQQLRKPEHQELLLSGLRIAMGRGLHEPDPLLRAADL